MPNDLTGKNVPHANFITRGDHDFITLTSDEVFKNKNVVVFALPGAFTPTCSSTHVPRYNQLAPLFKKHGIDDIICIAVNDGFVMNAWKEAEHADNVTFLADGNGDFTKAMGMLVDKHDLGFGKRSWRYSMLVRDGIIEKMFIEPEVEGDPFQVSDADTMLHYLVPNEAKPHNVTVFTRPGCPFCFKAKEALHKAGISFEELVLNRDYTDLTLRAVTGSTMVPKTYVDGALLGDSEATVAWAAKQHA